MFSTLPVCQKQSNCEGQTLCMSSKSITIGTMLRNTLLQHLGITPCNEREQKKEWKLLAHTLFLLIWTIFINKFYKYKYAYLLSVNT